MSMQSGALGKLELKFFFGTEGWKLKEDKPLVSDE